MLWLGMLYGVFSVVVPLGGLTVGRSVITYRTTGRERARSVRGAAVLLALSLLWSASGLALWLANGWPPGLPGQVEVAFQLAPLVLGWAPGMLALVLAWPPSRAAAAEAPGWVRWLDALWLG